MVLEAMVHLLKIINSGHLQDILEKNSSNKFAAPLMNISIVIVLASLLA